MSDSSDTAHKKKTAPVDMYDGRPALVKSVQHAEVVEALLSHPEIQVDAPDPVTGATALAFAAGHGHQRSVALLLEKGASVDAVGFRGRGALHGAALRGHLETVKLLLKYNANPYLKDDEGRTPLSDSQLKNHNAITTLFQSHCPVASE